MGTEATGWLSSQEAVCNRQTGDGEAGGRQDGGVVGLGSQAWFQRRGRVGGERDSDREGWEASSVWASVTLSALLMETQRAARSRCQRCRVCVSCSNLKIGWETGGQTFQSLTRASSRTLKWLSGCSWRPESWFSLHSADSLCLEGEEDEDPGFEPRFPRWEDLAGRRPVHCRWLVLTISQSVRHTLVFNILMSLKPGRATQIGTCHYYLTGSVFFLGSS